MRLDTVRRALLRAEGVVLIIESPEKKILVLKELESKPWLGKYAGMFSIPMETKKPWESDSKALKRLVDDELHGLEVKIDPEPHGSYRVVWGVYASLYVGRTENGYLPVPNGSREVCDHDWVSPEEATTMWLRRGAKEMLEDYIAGKTGVKRTYCRPVPARAT